ncbi:MAG TPA: hypothetical protein VHD85_02000 [Terracidiphilus sp.]|nr:hypothetical protein [Terracidiphilus sp.]
MSKKLLSGIQRRDFLKLVGATTVCGLAHSATAQAAGRVAVIIDADPIVSSAPVAWATGQLKRALASKSVSCEIVHSLGQAKGAALCVVAAMAESNLAKGFPLGAVPKAAESIRLAPGHVAGSPAVLVSAIDQRGFIYGLLELAERAQFSDNPIAAMQAGGAIDEKPANRTRCVSRYFCSEIEDKPWYYDKSFWPAYLDMLAASRFNRFCLAFGLEYDFPRGVTDDYLHLPYPYLVDVPGHSSVQVMQLRSPDGTKLTNPIPLSAEEKSRNFEMLKFIAAETGARGLHFQLGIWTHAYEWTDSPNAYHRIDGLTSETHATYCRDALAIILKECPQIQGLTMRVHGESGIPEGSYPFWKTLFEAISGAGRQLDVDMHAKGVNQTMIDIGVATGMPVTLGAKYSAEHQSLGYNQADIRALEIPNPNHHDDSRLFSLSGGSRLFTRYGYGDFFQEGSKARILYRLWPGTQRHLLSADPEMAAAYGRTANFCGAVGIDLMEPLTFKGREGSGHAGGRCAYADQSLNPETDWKKFEYYYRVWGRKLYDPEAKIEISRRYLRSMFGQGAIAVETALANCSRALPLITSAHLPSASNHTFWAELYTNMPIVEGSERSPYSDTPQPRCFGTVSPLDPQLFSTIVEHTQDLLTGRSNPKYSPIEVAQWLEDFTATASASIVEARAKVSSKSSPEFRRIEEDVLIQNGLGAFFAAKLRSGVLYEIFQQTSGPEAGKQALDQYKKARDIWTKMADRAKGVYVSDISYGDVSMRRGHWSDRLAAIDADIAAMQEKLQSPPVVTGSAEITANAVSATLGRPSRRSAKCTHNVPESFRPGQPLDLSLRTAGEVAGVRLHYRHVNQGERWLSIDMQGSDGAYHAAISAGYTNSAYPLQYYFEIAHTSSDAGLYPGFNRTLSNQPYYAIVKRNA